MKAVNKKQVIQTTKSGKLSAFGSDLRKNRIFVLLLLPAIAYALIFSYIPMGGVIMAFKSYNYSQGLFASPWVGLKNFNFLVVSNKLWPLTRNTLLYNLAFIIVGMAMEVGFAIILNEMRCKWFKRTFQSFIFLPYFIAWVIASAVLQNGADSGLPAARSALRSPGSEASASAADTLSSAIPTSRRLSWPSGRPASSAMRLASSPTPRSVRRPEPTAHGPPYYSSSRPPRYGRSTSGTRTRLSAVW